MIDMLISMGVEIEPEDYCCCRKNEKDGKGRFQGSRVVIYVLTIFWVF